MGYANANLNLPLTHVSLQLMWISAFHLRLYTICNNRRTMAQSAISIAVEFAQFTFDNPYKGYQINMHIRTYE